MCEVALSAALVQEGKESPFAGDSPLMADKYKGGGLGIAGH